MHLTTEVIKACASREFTDEAINARAKNTRSGVTAIMITPNAKSSKFDNRDIGLTSSDLRN
jgi:hypothetical protein